MSTITTPTTYTREQLIAASLVHHVTCVQQAIDEADRLRNPPEFTEAELIQGIRLGIADFCSRLDFPGTTTGAVIRRVIPQIREGRTS